MKNFITRLRDRVFGVDKVNYLLSQYHAKQKSIADYNMRELKAIEILKPYFPKEYVFESGFSMSFQAIQHIINDIVIYRPKVVLEFGSGLSTIILNNFVENSGWKVRLISIDNDIQWQEFLREKCTEVEFFHFPLIANHVFSFEKKGFWYDIPEAHLLLDIEYDLVVVDAPKGSLSKLSRHGFIPFLGKNLGENPVIYIDDTDRKDEQQISDLLLSNYSKDFISKKYYNYTRISLEEIYFTAPS